MRMLRRSDSRPPRSQPPASVPVCVGKVPGDPVQDAPSGFGTVDPAVVAIRLAHLLTHLPCARDVLADGKDLSVEFTTELTDRGFTVDDDDDLEHLLTGAAGDLTVIAAVAAVLSVQERYFSTTQSPHSSTKIWTCSAAGWTIATAASTSAAPEPPTTDPT